MAENAPILLPLTPEAREGIERDWIELQFFPFRIGRESRFGKVRGKWQSLERRATDAAPNNDFYIIDRGQLLNISREHFQIEQLGADRYELVDRGSTCGTIVDGDEIGGHDAGGQHTLKDGSTIRIGTEDSPYLFKFLLSRESVDSAS